MRFLRNLSVIEGVMLLLIVVALLTVGVVLSQRQADQEFEDRFATNTPVIDWQNVTPLALTADPSPAD